jgi:fructose-1,6-bisphosphatase/inositol monophosphatase family enzyme
MTLSRPSWGSGVPNGALLVATGRLDTFVLVGGGVWDHAAVWVVVEEAGGRCTDAAGGSRIDSGSAVFTNGHVHTGVLELLDASS